MNPSLSKVSLLSLGNRLSILTQYSLLQVKQLLQQLQLQLQQQQLQKVFKLNNILRALLSLEFFVFSSAKKRLECQAYNTHHPQSQLAATGACHATLSQFFVENSITILEYYLYFFDSYTDIKSLINVFVLLPINVKYFP